MRWLLLFCRHPREGSSGSGSQDCMQLINRVAEPPHKWFKARRLGRVGVFGCSHTRRWLLAGDRALGSVMRLYAAPSARGLGEACMTAAASRAPFDSSIAFKPEAGIQPGQVLTSRKFKKIQISNRLAQLQHICRSHLEPLSLLMIRAGLHLPIQSDFATPTASYLGHLTCV